MSDKDELPDDWLRHITSWAFVHEKPKHLGVAVSGGGDSMACLDLMLWHGRDQGFQVDAVTVNHGLRSEAKDEIALVSEYCRSRDVVHTTLNWEWEGKGNLQAKARDARYGLIAEWARGAGVDLVALGHTQDDVAETFLMRLARQSGVDGLAHMGARFERDGVTWVRPMMNHRRADWRTYLARHGVRWADDPSNEDETFERVKARKALKALEPLGIDAETLTAVAHNMGSAKQALEHYVWQEFHDFGEETHGELILPTDIATRDHLIPREISFRLVRKALMWVGGGEYPPRAEALTDMEVALRENEHHTLGGCLVNRIPGKRRFEDRWRITREYNAVKDVASSTDGLWDGRWALDGPNAPDLEVRTLGEAVKDCPDWRETGLPRQSLLASPAIWRGNELIAAPLAGLSNGWTASATGRGTFAQFLLSR